MSTGCKGCLLSVNTASEMLTLQMLQHGVSLRLYELCGQPERWPLPFEFRPAKFVLTCASLMCRYMFDADGQFNDNHINNWQHAAMYFGYTVAGLVDVAAHFTDLPAASGQVTVAEALFRGVSTRLKCAYTVADAVDTAPTSPICQPAAARSAAAAAMLWSSWLRLRSGR